MAKGKGIKAANTAVHVVPTPSKPTRFPITLLHDRPHKQIGSLETLLPGYIMVVRNFLSPDECQKWIDYIEGSSLEYAAHRATRYMANRECYRMQRDDPDLAARLFERIIQCVRLPPTPIACNPNIRIYKYTKGHAFGKHIDESNTVPGVGHTRYTILIYLSDCQGGATSFDPPTGRNPIKFAPQAGALLVHLHGDDCLVHQGEAVQSGIKYVLRTDIVYAD